MQRLGPKLLAEAPVADSGTKRGEIRFVLAGLIYVELRST